MKNVLTIVTGTSISQIIPFVVAPFLTRIFTPADFGLLALFNTTSLLFGNIATFQYETAIMLPPKDKDAINLVALSILITSCVSLSVLLLIILFNQPIVKLMSSDEIEKWLYLIPLSVFFSGLFRSLNMWSSRKKKFKRVAVRNIVQTTTTAGSKLLLGKLTYLNGSLIIGSVAGQFAAVIYLLWRVLTKDRITFTNISVTHIKENAQKYSKFPKFSLWLGLTNMLNESSVRYIISGYYGATVLGLYSFTIGLLQKPTQFIGQAISQVFFQKTSELRGRGKSSWKVLKVTLFYLIFTGILIYSPILLFGDVIFQFVFGEKWIVAGVYAQFLVPWVFIKFVFTPISAIPAIFGEQKKELLYRLGFNMLIPTTFFLMGMSSYTFTTLLFVSSVMAFLFLSFMIFWLRGIVIKNDLLLPEKLEGKP